MNFNEFKAKLKVRLLHYIEVARKYGNKAGTAAMSPRVLAVLGLATAVAIGVTAETWYMGFAGVTIMALALFLHTYNVRKGF